MGIFSNSNKTLNSKEVLHSLYQIHWLSSKEREEIMEAVSHQLDSGGIAEYELEKILRELEKSDKISQTQKKLLKKALLS